MIFASSGLFLIAIIILTKDYKTESTKFMAAICFLAGIGTLAAVCEGPIKEYLVTQGASGETFKLITYIGALMSNIAHFIGPYFMLLYGLSYANIVKIIEVAIGHAVDKPEIQSNTLVREIADTSKMQRNMFK